MAKRKTPKTEKIVDLKPEVEKITEERLKQIQQVISMANKIKLEVGNAEARKHALLHELDVVNSQIAEINKEIEAEYGKVDIDISTGEIKYLSDEQAD
jgi:hypothetical protein